MNFRNFLALFRVPPVPVGIGERLRAGLSAFIAIGFVGTLSSRFIEGAGLPTLVASMGASSVILFAVPNSPMAQPWSLLGGHLLSALIGVSCALWLPEPRLAGAIAVGLAIFVMYSTHCLHPPGGATALVPALSGPAFEELGFRFVLTPVALNVFGMLLLALLLNNAGKGRRYPIRPEPKKPVEREDPEPMKRLGIAPEDLHQALVDMNSYTDVAEPDLQRIYDAAALHAYRREFGETTCGRLMSKDLVAVEFATDLDEAWSILRHSGVKALPVVGRGRHVIGVVTTENFIEHAGIEEVRGFAARLKRLLARTPTVTSTKPEVVGQIMTAPPVTLPENAHIAELVPLMADGGLHHVPIVDGQGKLAGIIAQSDLVAALYRNAVSLHSSID